jgi:dihydrodipicolinate synthase/N-acetylneuraminate lyase
MSIYRSADTALPHLSIFTGTGPPPEALTAGGRGTICGLGNIMPRLLRGLLDLPTAFDGRQLVPTILSGDTILSRGTFHASIKAVLARRTAHRLGGGSCRHMWICPSRSEIGS